MAIFHKTKDKSDKSDTATTFTAEQMEEVKTSLSTTQDELAKLGEDHETLVATQEGSVEAIATLTTSNETLTESVATLTTDLEASKAETVKADASAATKAIEMLAKVGHKPANLEDSNNGSGDQGKSAYDEYRELQKTSPDKAAKFWEDNKASITNK
jgi:hypothetical protein